MTLRHKPTLPYCGLTVVMSNESRFDLQNKKLLEGEGGRYFADCLYPHFNRFQCDIRVLTDTSDYLPNTKCILALGESAQQTLGRTATTINENRGSPLVSKEGIPIISTYNAQDTQDIKDYEGQYNELLNGSTTDTDSSNEESAIEDKQRHGKTSRKNYRFWFARDVEKACRVTLGEYANTIRQEFNYIIYPNGNDVLSNLSSSRGAAFYFDIETDRDLNITCFSYSFGDNKVFVVPLISHDYTRSYHNTGVILGALALAIRNNTCVAHNGAGFDFLVLAHKYHIPIGHKVYDTMLAQNRIYPEAEKSLGHCISLPWMYEAYHKDEGSFAYGNQQQAMALWRYCGKDVSSLILLKKAQDDYAKTKVGLRSSIDAVQSYVRSYLTCTLTGIRYSKELLDSTVTENDRLMMFYLKCLRILVGEKWLKIIRGQGKSSMPGSNKQCVKYFHELLKYPVVLKSRDTGKPSLGKKALFKLKLRFNSPVIDIIIAYRKLQKESSALKFIPYKE